MNKPFLRRVRLQNYRSIARCDVALARLTFLVGPNGSGKSNFLDALRFVAQSLQLSLEHAVRDRGGINEVRRRSSGHPTHFGMRLDMELPDGSQAYYAFRIGARRDGGYIVQREECGVGALARYRVEEGAVVRGLKEPMPPAAPDRLYLVAAAGVPVFRPVYDALSAMRFFNPVPDLIRRPQEPDPGEVLARDGRNLASVYERTDPEARRRIQEYLGHIVPGLRHVDVRHALGLETLEFRQDVEGTKHPWRFKALSMSDGSLRAFGVLVALFHRIGEEGNGTASLVGLEEPEMALHPAAAGVLFDALSEASEDRQVLVTTHSPDLLDRDDVPTEALRAVVMDQGRTQIGPLSETGRKILQQGLYTPGELLRLSQLEPDPVRSNPRQLNLFQEETG